MKNEGITLIALIITIIVLLILAGVSLNMVMGDNGLLTKATTVELEYTKSEVEENLEMIINQKLVAAYESVQEKGGDISEYYNENKILSDLDTNGYISLSAGIGSTVRDVQDTMDVAEEYVIDVSKLSSEIDKYGLGTYKEDVFTLKVNAENGVSTGTYTLGYYDEDGEYGKLVDIVLYATNDS